MFPGSKAQQIAPPPKNKTSSCPATAGSRSASELLEERSLNLKLSWHQARPKTITYRIFTEKELLKEIRPEEVIGPMTSRYRINRSGSCSTRRGIPIRQLTDGMAPAHCDCKL